MGKKKGVKAKGKETISSQQTVVTNQPILNSEPIQKATKENALWGAKRKREEQM